MRRLFFFCGCRDHLDLPSFPTRRSSDLYQKLRGRQGQRRDVSLDEVLPLFDERGRHVGPTADWSDRKSTRLNSSHTVISYAVFCLKKKTEDSAPSVEPARARRRP